MYNIELFIIKIIISLLLNSTLLTFLLLVSIIYICLFSKFILYNIIFILRLHSPYFYFGFNAPTYNCNKFFLILFKDV